MGSDSPVEPDTFAFLAKAGKLPVFSQAPEAVLSVLSGPGRSPRDFDWLRVNIPCQAACPAGTDIPGYLDAIAQGHYADAYRCNLRDNVFPAVLGRVCTRPCEPVCRHGREGLGDPVAICFAKRSADDFMDQEKPVLLTPAFPSSGRRVCVIGAGAAGLAVARDLCLLGHEVEVLEREQEPGGLMTQGIPAFRLPRELVHREIRQIVEQGVRIQCGREIESMEQVEGLQTAYGSVVLACGAWLPRIPDLPGFRQAGVLHGLSFLRAFHQGHAPPLGKHVVVIGGGFTAVDCARVAWRSGAEAVSIFYRRTEREMVIAESERKALREEGILFRTQRAPLAIRKRSDGTGLEVVFAETIAGEADADGRVSFTVVPGTEEVVFAETVLLGTGQEQDFSWLPEKTRSLLLDRGQDGNLFIAGDAFSGPGSLIEAIGHGRSTARRVDAFLMGADRVEDVAWVAPADRTGRDRSMDAIPRQHMEVLPVVERSRDAEVDMGFSKARAETEARRCYLCHYKFEIDNDLCIYCDRCLKVMPVQDCIVRVDTLETDEEGRIIGLNQASGMRDYNLLFIQQDACIRCGACAEVCPVACIRLEKVMRKTCAVAGDEPASNQ